MLQCLYRVALHGSFFPFIGVNVLAWAKVCGTVGDTLYRHSRHTTIIQCLHFLSFCRRSVRWHPVLAPEGGGGRTSRLVDAVHLFVIVCLYVCQCVCIVYVCDTNCKPNTFVVLLHSPTSSYEVGRTRGSAIGSTVVLLLVVSSFAFVSFPHLVFVPWGSRDPLGVLGIEISGKSWNPLGKPWKNLLGPIVFLCEIVGNPSKSISFLNFKRVPFKCAKLQTTHKFFGDSLDKSHRRP